MSIELISPQALYEKIKAGADVTLIDVRTPIEFREVHATGAKNIPLDTLKPKTLIAKHGASQEPIYMICRSGGRAGQACEQMIKAGFERVVSVEGGTSAWEAAGLPVVRDRGVISLERQVRIVAGALVFIGTLLGFFVHACWLIVPAFIGAGLAFAGITNTCGMGMLLAKMPWNHVKQDKQATGTSCGISCGVSPETSGSSDSCSIRK